MKINSLVLIVLLYFTTSDCLSMSSNYFIGSFKPSFSEGVTTSPVNKSNKSQLYYFGTKKTTISGKQINSQVIYDSNLGYGFDFNTSQNIQINKDDFSANKPTYFSVKLTEGNYRVTVTMGSEKKASCSSIKAESRRLMIKELSIKKGETIVKSFNVNIRDVKINETSSVHIKTREEGQLNWDNKLTLEFLGDVVVKKIEITPIDDIVTVFLAGDSTVTDQDLEPWASWGQFITNYFNKEIVVANYASSGESLSSFKARGRLNKILAIIKPNDFLIIEFAHNDEKRRGDGIGPWKSYSDLLTEFIGKAREKKAIPILVTPTQRRLFNENGTLKPTHGDYPDAMRSIAKKLNVPLIDISKMTKTLYETWGDDVSRKAFVQYPPNTFPGQVKKLEDNTHFNNFGAHEIALCVLQGIRDSHAPIEKYIVKNLPCYTPKKPNHISSWSVPLSARFEAIKPDGN